MTGGIPADIEVFLRQYATDDVRATVGWLLDHAYAYVRHHGASHGLSSFGSSIVLAGSAEVTLTVDRGQWFMDIAPVPSGPSYQFDLLVAAHRGRIYWECLPVSSPRDCTAPLPAQLPAGVVWCETLPEVLAWLGSTVASDVAAAVKLAQDQRFAVMWPDSHTGKRLRRTWRAQGMPLPP